MPDAGKVSRDVVHVFLKGEVADDADPARILSAGVDEGRRFRQPLQAYEMPRSRWPGHASP